jgi:hypothetical protein
MSSQVQDPLNSIEIVKDPAKYNTGKRSLDDFLNRLMPLLPKFASTIDYDHLSECEAKSFFTSVVPALFGLLLIIGIGERRPGDTL